MIKWLNNVIYPCSIVNCPNNIIFLPMDKSITEIIGYNEQQESFFSFKKECDCQIYAARISRDGKSLLIVCEDPKELTSFSFYNYKNGKWSLYSSHNTKKFSLREGTVEISENLNTIFYASSNIIYKYDISKNSLKKKSLNKIKSMKLFNNNLFVCCETPKYGKLYLLDCDRLHIKNVGYTSSFLKIDVLPDNPDKIYIYDNYGADAIYLSEGLIEFIEPFHLNCTFIIAKDDIYMNAMNRRKNIPIAFYKDYVQIHFERLEGQANKTSFGRNYLGTRIYVVNENNKVGYFDIEQLSKMTKNKDFQRKVIQMNYPVHRIICQCCNEPIPCPNCGETDLLRGWERYAICYGCGAYFNFETGEIIEIFEGDRDFWGAMGLAMSS
ncbi:MAG: hypothetical protein ACTSVV_02180 [Promethearchaeota archaeon]